MHCIYHHQAYHVVGSDEAENYFRVLEISRNDRSLVIRDDKKVYKLEQVQGYLNRLRGTERRKSTLNKVVSGYCLAGFIKFTEGYYMILVTSRQKVAVVGSHVIYKVQGTRMIYIPNDHLTKSPDEIRYMKLFESMDLSDNFYFSFTYDLTHTLQYNQKPIMKEEMLSPTAPYIEARQSPMWQFVWNEYLLEPVRDRIHDDWIVTLIHGYLSQLNMTVFGRHIYITLIARRSNRYAGPRFLKRGSNSQGNVGNEVETEQIVSDVSQTSFDGGAVTSYVQLRGSIPLYWAQDLTKIAMSKPPIVLHFSDPYGSISGLHFQDLLKRYGAPVVLLSLVKRREKKPREGILWDELVQSINYLNQFLVDEHKIKYVAFDMARSNRKVGSNVLAHLDDISEKCIDRTGICVRNSKAFPDTDQHGIIRTNCVDCLDRTNTAQFAVGKHALGHQLNALGVIPTADLEFDTDCLRMLETLYEDQGDTIALQYGGSNLVHRVRSYKKTDPLSSQSNDIIQTLSRYYSNSFSDAEKQQAFNIFLGVYRPYKENTALWDLSTDHYLHNKHFNKSIHYCEWVPTSVVNCLPEPYYAHRKSFSLVERDFPGVNLNCFEVIYRLHHLTTFDTMFSFSIDNSVRNFMPKTVNLETDMYAASPFEVRKTVRWRHLSRLIRPGSQSHAGSSRRLSLVTSSMPSRGSSSSVKEMGNSVFHAGVTTDDTDSSSSEESDIEYELNSNSSNSDTENNDEASSNYVSFADILPNSYREYGVDMDFTNKASTKLYNQYEKIQEQINAKLSENSRLPSCQIGMSCKSMFRRESVYQVVPPTVKKEVKKFYTQVVLVGQHGAQSVPKANERMYEKYLRMAML